MSAKASAPGVQGGEHVGEHDQPVQLAEHGRDQIPRHRVPIGVEAGREQAREAAFAGMGKEDRERRLRPGRRHQEPARLKEGQPRFVPKPVERGPVEPVAGRGQRLVGRGGGRQTADEGQEVARERRGASGSPAGARSLRTTR